MTISLKNLDYTLTNIGSSGPVFYLIAPNKYCWIGMTVAFYFLF